MPSHKLQLSSDLKHVYFNGRVSPLFIAKLFLFSAVSTFFIGLTLVLFSKSFDQNQLTGFILIGLSLIIIIPLGRSFLWNVFGEENLAISKDNLVYHHNFGFTRSEEIEIKHNGMLSFDFEITNQFQNDFEGILHIYERQVNGNHLDKKLYSTVIRITEKEANQLIEKVQEVFENHPEQRVFNYSLN